MKVGSRVRVTKVAGKVDATLPMGYEVVGVLSVFEEDLPLVVYGHGPEDSVKTTPVEMLNWDGDKKAYAHTANSTWRLELVEE